MEQQRELIDVIEQRDKLIILVSKLKQMLSRDGEYSICRSDGENMGLGESIIIGDIFQELDQIIIIGNVRKSK